MPHERTKYQLFSSYEKTCTWVLGGCFEIISSEIFDISTLSIQNKELFNEIVAKIHFVVKVEKQSIFRTNDKV